MRGKLLTIDRPKIVLITKGRVSADFIHLSDTDVYTLVRRKKSRAPAPEYVAFIEEALSRFAPVASDTEERRGVAGARVGRCSDEDLGH